MTVSSLTRKVVANGNSSATSFSFSPIAIFSPGDLVVKKEDADGVITTLTRGSGAANYTVVVSSYPGTGSVTYPNSGTALATGEKISIERVLALTQSLDLENQGGYYADLQEQEFDRLTMIAIQQIESLNTLEIEHTAIVEFLGLTISLDINETATVGGSLSGSIAYWNLDTEWTKRVKGATPKTLSDGTTVDWDMSLGNMFVWTLTNSGHTLANPTNLKNGDTGYLFIIENDTGGWEPAFGDHYVLVGGTPTWETGVSKENYCSYVCYNDLVYVFYGGHN